jgi:hypothetical protein
MVIVWLWDYVVVFSTIPPSLTHLGLISSLVFSLLSNFEMAAGPLSFVFSNSLPVPSKCEPFVSV